MKTLARLLVIGVAAALVAVITWALVQNAGNAAAATRGFENRPAFALGNARQGFGDRRGGHYDREAGGAGGWLTLGKNVLIVGALTAGVAGVMVAGDRWRKVRRPA